MNPAEKELVHRAAACLAIRDITLFSSKFERPFQEGLSGDMDAEQQHMRHVAIAKGEVKDGEDTKRIIQIRVSLGTRLVLAEQRDGDVDPILFVIEATFLADYFQNEDLSDEELNVFSSYNAVHNVWPFWRQHVYDIVQRARLPQLEVPLFAGVKEAQPQ